MSELFGGRGSQILEERRDRLLRSLSEQMQDLDERTVRKDYFETEEGFDLLIKALDEALRTRSKEKIAFYARILTQSATTYRQGRYFPEEYLNVLAGLTPKQVEVAWTMYEVQEKPREGYDPEASEAWRRQSEEVCKRLGLAQSQLIFMLKGLVASGLVAEIGRTMPGTIAVEYSITPSFEEMMDFLESSK